LAIRSLSHCDQERIARFLFRGFLDALDQVDDLRVVPTLLLLDQVDRLGIDGDELAGPTAELARVQGMGPLTLAKFGGTLLELTGPASKPGP
jgi:hypothetical protein